MGSYNPQEVKSYIKKVSKQGEWGRLKRFSENKSGSGLGPGKYIGPEDWTNQSKQIVARQRPKSAYYN